MARAFRIEWTRSVETDAELCPSAPAEAVRAREVAWGALLGDGACWLRL